MAIVNYKPPVDEPIFVAAKCGMPGCIYDAKIKVFRKQGGYTNVCRSCYDKLFKTYAHAWCQKKGLDAKQKQIDYCKRLARSFNLKVAA